MNKTIEKKQWIDCRKCGDSVEMPIGKVWCYQCIEESTPKQTDQ